LRNKLHHINFILFSLRSQDIFASGMPGVFASEGNHSFIVFASLDEIETKQSPSFGNEIASGLRPSQ
jgi:hypothetical protein